MLKIDNNNIDKIDKIDLLVQVAKLYYEFDYSQQMIADKLNISRPYVSRLINQAKAAGIVEIIIHDPNETETKIEKEIKERFGLQRVTVLPVSGEQRKEVLSKLAVAAGRFLNNIVADNDVIGVVWGDTLYECSKNLIKREDIKNVTVVQLCGGVSRVDRNIFVSEIPRNFAEAYNGVPYTLSLPAILDGVDLKNALMKEKNIAEVVAFYKKINIAIITVGLFTTNSTLVRAGYLSKKQVDELKKKGAVGDIFSRFIDINGKICCPELDQKTVAIELADFKKIKNKIVVVTGVERAKCLCGVLRGGYCDVLITDEETALEVLRITDKDR